MLKPAVALSAALALIGPGIVVATPAQATSYNWGNPPNVCDQVGKAFYNDPVGSAYSSGLCAPAISPQQTVQGTTSLQYFVTCADAGGGVGQYATASGTYYQSLAYAMGLDSYSDVVAWTTGSTVVSGEEATASANGGYVSGDSYAYGVTPVKVYNAEVAWESTTVTFAAACINEGGIDSLNGLPIGTTADASEGRIGQVRSAGEAAMARTQRDFASGERKRAEFQVRAKTRTGVEVHDRINLKPGRTEKSSLLCPRGMTPSGDPQTSYGFDALKDVSDYEPRITAKRAWSTRGVTLSYSAGKLKYPTVAYTVLPCGKPAR